MDTSRLFFALWPDVVVRDKVVKLAQQFHQKYGGRLVTKESLHVTLAFLGETPNARLADLYSIGSNILTPCFNLVLSRAGSWSGGIFWLAPEESPSALTALADTLFKRLHEAGIAFDSKRFVPHMTILRHAGSRGQETNIEPIEITLRDFVLIKTVREQKGVSYEILARFPLGEIQQQ